MTSVSGSLRATEYFARSYRATWRGSVLSTFLSPVLYLAALGVGLGSFIDRGGHARASLGGVPYLHFVAPALLAVTAMQVATGESTFPVLAALKWRRTYFAMLATPLGVEEVLVGHVAWIALRVLSATAAYLCVVAAFGVVASPWAVLAVPAAALVGMAFAIPIIGMSARVTNDAAFNILYRLVVLPLFLFSGTFFPVSQLPAGVRAVAYATPLYQGVALCRGLVLGTVDAASLGHVAYLLALVGVGIPWAHRGYLRRLRT